MITVINRKIYEGLPFEDYLKLPGVSHSDIRNKGNRVFATPKMQLGTLTHTYLLTPSLYSGEHATLVVPLAKKLKAEIGPLLPFLRPEISVTCDFVAMVDGKEWILPYRGRADIGKPGRIGIDIKVSEMPLQRSVAFFDYDNQQNGYALGFGFQAVIIVAINPKTHLISMYNVHMTPLWWKIQIPKYGKPLYYEKNV